MTLPKACIVTLGCRLNHADSALLADRLERAGFSLAQEGDAPLSLIVLNSCAVTAEAEAKSRRLAAKLRREHPEAKIVITGCSAELQGDKLLAFGADEVLTNVGKKEFGHKTSSKKSREIPPKNFRENALSRFPFRTRAFIKVQEGCDNHCTYCIVPTVRGPSRSRAFEECIDDCRQSIEAGFPEIVLTGVNTCHYHDEGKDLGDLISAVTDIPGEFRLRLGSTEPNPGDLTLPDLIAGNPKLCRFLHLSMQHGSDRILRAMNRHYTAEEFASFVSEARKRVPDIHIGTDFIVGFPGETERDFLDALEVLKTIGFANIHAFAYSRRPGTPAAAMTDQVPAEAVKERMKELRRVAEKSAAAFVRSQYGKVLPVIPERCKNGFLTGWSDNYIEVILPAGSFPEGVIVPVTGTRENLRFPRERA